MGVEYQLLLPGAEEAEPALRDAPKVINRHHYKDKALPWPYVYIGRGTPLGNPYTVAEHGMEALELYRRHLWAKIRAGDREALEVLERLTPHHHLVCSCAPRPCHGDVVVRAWRWLQAQGRVRWPKA